MSSFPRNLFPISFKRPSPGKESPYYADTSELFLHNDGDDDVPTSNGRTRSWRCCRSDEPNMTFYRLFYLLFHGATALFAYLPLYYKKSLLLDHHHIGILMGIRPLCKFLSTPLLGSLADKFNKYQSFLYAGLLTYTVVYLSITFIDGIPSECGGKLANPNLTIYNINGTLCNKTLSNITNCNSVLNTGRKQITTKRRIEESDDRTPMYDSTQKDNADLHLSANEGLDTMGADVSFDYDNATDGGSEVDLVGEDAAWPLDVYLVWQRKKSTTSDDRTKIQKDVFIFLLLLMILAEFFGAPIPTLADTATLQNLRKEPYNYGYQRAWGSIGFGLMSVIFGSVLHVTVTENEDVNNCPEKTVNKYRPVFYCYFVLLLMSFFSTFQFRFREYKGKDTSGCSIFKCIKFFENVEYALLAFLAWFTGLAHGLSTSFVYVYLIHMGATPLNLLLTAAAQSMSKMIFFLLSPRFIINYGNFIVIYIGLVANIIVFFCYSFLGTPWMAVPIELLSGLATSCIWSALVSYVGAPPKIGATLQGILHAMHAGLGSGIGGLFGGMVLVHYGFKWLFRLFSLSTFFVFFMVAAFRYWRKKEVEPIWKALWDYSPISEKPFIDDD